MGSDFASSGRLPFGACCCALGGLAAAPAAALLLRAFLRLLLRLCLLFFLVLGCLGPLLPGPRVGRDTGQVARHGRRLLGARRVVLAQEARAGAPLEFGRTAVTIRAGVGEHLRGRFAGVDIALRQGRARDQARRARRRSRAPTAALSIPSLSLSVDARLNFTAKPRAFCNKTAAPTGTFSLPRICYPGN